MESSAKGLPPLLVVQGGPGFPLLNERRRYRRLLGLEERFSVFYWDRSGAGLHSPPTGRFDLDAHVGETVALVKRLARTFGRRVRVLGISIGGTVGLLARQRAPEAIDRVVAISPDLDGAAGERHAHARILASVREPRWHWLAPKAARLQPPPCVDPAQFRLRAELLGHLGSLEADASYGTQLLRTALSIAGTYGPHRLPRVVANMDASMRALLPEYSALDLISRWPRSAVPVDLVFGDADLLSPAEMIDRVHPLLGLQDTLRVVHGAAHMAHFDAPAVVRSVVLGEEPFRSPGPTRNGPNRLHTPWSDPGLDVLRN
ncbi:MAG TPA: alpha/beta hydrolase [Myxococcaceae bacterium]|nr:alpha/beta hydrolase [Myxococcaceae bacterium]